MTLTKQIAKHFKDVHFGGNWTFSNLKDNLEGVTWQQATTQIYSLNTITTLVFHVNYYTEAMIEVLQGRPLNAHDKYSFDVPPINSQEEWDKLRNKALTDAETFASLVEQLPDSILSETFADEKYGNYFRNLHGAIEHAHYHLGQIAVIKKILNQMEKDTEKGPS